MLAWPLAQRAGRLRLSQLLLIPAIPVVCLVSEPAGAQTCYQFSVFIRQAADVSSNPFPEGFTAAPPPFSVWGDHPSSSMDLGHVKLASVSFVGPCTARQ
jgi:hypothetical protein